MEKHQKIIEKVIEYSRGVEALNALSHRKTQGRDDTLILAEDIISDFNSATVSQSMEVFAKKYITRDVEALKHSSTGAKYLDNSIAKLYESACKVEKLEINAKFAINDLLLRDFRSALKTLKGCFDQLSQSHEDREHLKRFLLILTADPNIGRDVLLGLYETSDTKHKELLNEFYTKTYGIHRDGQLAQKIVYNKDTNAHDAAKVKKTLSQTPDNTLLQLIDLNDLFRLRQHCKINEYKLGKLCTTLVHQAKKDAIVQS